MNYKKLIIELLEKIDNGKFLRRIYVSLREYARGGTRDWTGSRQKRWFSLWPW